MTHTTHVRFLEPVDPEQVFGYCRELIGIPSTQPMTTRGQGWLPYSNGMCVGSLPGGYPAALDMIVVPSGETMCGDEFHLRHGHWEGETKTPDAEQCMYSHRRFFVEVRFDTSYGSSNCAGCLHLDYIRALRARFPERLIWEDESWGEWHEQIPDGPCETAHDLPTVTV